MIKPVFHHVLIHYEHIYDTDPAFIKAKKAGIAFAEEIEDAQRRQAGIDKGNIAAMGPDAFEDTNIKPKVGDRVGFAKHSGKIVQDEKTEKKYVLINDEDVHYIQE